MKSEKMALDEAIEFCKEKSRNIKLRIEQKTFEQIAEWLEEMKAYRTICTKDEYRTYVDKQKAKKIVRVKLRQSEWGSEYRCPVCESDLIKTVFFNEDGTEPDKKIYWCSRCGQKLDWSDEDNE